jgi:alpha-glucan,water dikinase
MAHAQERIGGTMASACTKSSDAIVRTLIRLCVRAVPRGNSGGGDSIRHGILNIMRTHGIKEGHRPGIECKFLEQWHQKLHTNSAPDDIAICSGYLAFLSSGNADDMWRVIWDIGGLTRDDLSKMCQAGYVDHTKSGARGLNHVPVHLPHMYNDVQSYLGLLRHVHGGSDLCSLCDACKGQYPDHGAECLAFDIYNGRDDPFTAGKILDMRRRLEPLLGKRDILMLDVAMEDLFRSLSERTDFSSMPQDDLLNILALMVEDLCMSRHSVSLQQGSDLLQRLVKGDHGGCERGSPEWCKMVHAACDRISLTCAAFADKVAELLQNCADDLKKAGQTPGAVFQPDEKALTTFGEEKARCLTERLVAQALKFLKPMLRRGAGLGPWEIVSQGQGGQAIGTIEVMSVLPAEISSGKAPIVAVVETMTGWEDIPGGITALLLPAGQAVDTLSHVAIRARNQHVLLASCDEESILEGLRSAAGSSVLVEIAPSGVKWAPCAKAGDSDKAAKSATKSVMQKIVPPPQPPATVIPASAFIQHKKSLGGKSLHLAELKPVKDKYSVPVSATIPYRTFEKALKDPANDGIEEELEEIIQTGDWAEARNFIIEELAVPKDIETALMQTLVSAGAPPLRGDWERALKGVWASKWTDRAISSRKQMKVPDEILFLAVLVQPVVPAAYAFVIHTQSPLPGAKKDEQLVELCVGLGESLVSNTPGRALSASVGPGDQPSVVHVFPSKPDGVFTPEGGTFIFRSDSNGEDLEGFAGAGLYDSITVEACTHSSVSYTNEPLLFDASFRESLLKRLYELGRLVEANFSGAPQDIEGAIHTDGSIVVTQSRPQV